MTGEELQKAEMIDRYLKNKASEEEVRTIETEAAANPEFAEEIRLHRKVNELLLEAGLLDVKQKLEGIHKRRKKVTYKRFLWLIAGMMLMGGLVYENTKTENPEEKSEMNLSPIPTSDITAKRPAAPKEYHWREHNLPLLEPDNTRYWQGVLNRNKEYIIEEKKRLLDHTRFIDSVSLVYVQLKQPLKADIKDNSTIETKEPRAPVRIPVPDTLTNTKSADAKISCAGTVIIADLNIKETCIEEANGYIEFQNESGGSGKYVYSIDNGKSFSGEPKFTGLDKGSYKVLLADVNGCKSAMKEVKLKGDRCEKMKFSFYPAEGQVWEIPIDSALIHADIELIIEDKRGFEIFTSVISNSFPETWDGKDNKGNPVPKDEYIFKLNYASGKRSTGLIRVK